MRFSCIFNKGHSVFTGKGNQYWFIIYKGSHWSVTTCGRSTQQVSFAASSIRGRVQPPSASAQPEGHLILSHFLLPRAPRWGWQEPTALPRGQAPCSTAAPARHRPWPLPRCCPREPTRFHPSPRPQVGPSSRGTGSARAAGTAGLAPTTSKEPLMCCR